MGGARFFYREFYRIFRYEQKVLNKISLKIFISLFLSKICVIIMQIKILERHLFAKGRIIPMNVIETASLTKYYDKSRGIIKKRYCIKNIIKKGYY